MPKQENNEKLQELLWSFAGHRVLTVAGRTGILETLAVGDATVLELARKLDLDELPTGKIVRALHAMGLLVTNGDRFGMTGSFKEMFAPGPSSFTPFLEHSHDMYDRWGENLESWLKGEQWQTKKRDGAGVARFGAAMKAMASRVAAQVVAAIDLSGVGRMLDIGGGTGAYAETFCRASGLISATVFDTDQVAILGRERVAGTDMEDRLEFLGGDYLDSDYGEGFDFVLLANVLHQESEERACRLVSKAAGVLAPGGRVAVVDFSIDDLKRENLLGALFAINMRSFGDTYPEPVITGWMKEAGLSNFKRIDLDKTRWVITGAKYS